MRLWEGRGHLDAALVVGPCWGRAGACAGSTRGASRRGGRQGAFPGKARVGGVDGCFGLFAQGVRVWMRDREAGQGLWDRPGQVGAVQGRLGATSAVAPAWSAETVTVRPIC